MSTTPWNAPPSHERLSAAWASVAFTIADGEWHAREELIADVVSDLAEAGYEPLQRPTINGILSQAARAGYFERWPKNAKRAKYGARKYRVTEEGRRQCDELRVR